jgi:hypothetical protein
VPERVLETTVESRWLARIALWRSRRLRAGDSSNLLCRVRLNRWDEIVSLLALLGFGDVEVRVFPVRSNGDRHPFWLARRPAGS